MLRRILFCLVATAGSLALVAPASARETVAFSDTAVRPGTIVVKTKERKLYLVVGKGQAIRYPVAVGRNGKQWQGEARINAKYVEPAWSPPDEIKRDNPRLPDVIAGGSPRNPMGLRALTLQGGDYAIHGTNVPGSVGHDASYGCFRMLNRDIVDLYERVRVGTTVLVTR